jgi:hypothetical protein
MEWLKYREKLPKRLNLRTRPWEKSNPINKGVCNTYITHIFVVDHDSRYTWWVDKNHPLIIYPL